MRVLVTGGTGFTGTALVKRLLVMGHAVVALDYKEGLQSDDLRAKGAEILTGSVTDRQVVEQVARALEMSVRISHYPVLPVLPVVALGHIMDKVYRPFGLAPPIFPRRVDWYRQNRLRHYPGQARVGVRTAGSPGRGPAVHRNMVPGERLPVRRFRLHGTSGGKNAGRWLPGIANRSGAICAVPPDIASTGQQSQLPLEVARKVSL